MLYSASAAASARTAGLSGRRRLISTATPRAIRPSSRLPNATTWRSGVMRSGTGTVRTCSWRCWPAASTVTGISSPTPISRQPSPARSKDRRSPGCTPWRARSASGGTCLTSRIQRGPSLQHNRAPMPPAASGTTARSRVASDHRRSPAQARHNASNQKRQSRVRASGGRPAAGSDQDSRAHRAALVIHALSKPAQPRC